MAHTERRRLIPAGVKPRSILDLGGGGGRGGSTGYTMSKQYGAAGGGQGQGQEEQEETRDEHLDLFLSKAAAYGFQVREIEFDRRAGEELVHLFDVRRLTTSHQRHHHQEPGEQRSGERRRPDDEQYDVFTLD